MIESALLSPAATGPISRPASRPNERDRRAGPHPPLRLMLVGQGELVEVACVHLQSACDGRVQLRRAPGLDEALQHIDRGYDAVLLGLEDEQVAEAVRWLHAEAPAVAIVVLAKTDQPLVAEAALLAGAQEWLCLDDGGIARLCPTLRQTVRRHRVHSQLLRESRRYRTMIEQASEVLFEATPEGVLTYVSPSWSALLGRPREEVLGRHFGTFIHPEDLARVEQSLALLRAAGGTSPEVELRVAHADGQWLWFAVRSTAVCDGAGDLLYVVGLARDITAHRAADQDRQRLAAAISHAPVAVLITDLEANITYANPAFEQSTGYSRAEVMGRNPRLLNSGRHGPEFYADLWRTVTSGRTWRGRLINRRKDGTEFEEQAIISPVLDQSGRIASYVAVKHDLTESKQLEAQLLQAQKLESIGQLAAGIAHEINTPTQFVSDNTTFLTESLDGLVRLLGEYDGLLEAARQGAVSPTQIESIDQLRDEIALDMLLDEIPDALQQSAEGLERIADIVRAVKRFSHPGAEEKELIDLNEALRTTGMVSRNEWKYVARLELALDDDLPLVPGYPGDLNQVFLNLIVNAAHAIAEQVGAMPSEEERGTIAVGARRDGAWVEVAVTDTGCGMSEEVQRRACDPFFTTKKVGRGTGQGLYIAHDVVVNKHGGRLQIESNPGRGTTLRVYLPLGEEVG